MYVVLLFFGIYGFAKTPTRGASAADFDVGTPIDVFSGGIGVIATAVILPKLLK